MTHRELGCTWPDQPCTCTPTTDQAELDGQEAATELQALLGVPPGTEGVRLPE